MTAQKRTYQTYAVVLHLSHGYVRFHDPKITFEGQPHLATPIPFHELEERRQELKSWLASNWDKVEEPTTHDLTIQVTHSLSPAVTQGARHPIEFAPSPPRP